MLRSRLASGRSLKRPKMDTNYPYVELRIPADPLYVRIARLTAGDMGGRVGFSVDELDDIRLAVDEVCATLIAAGGQRLELRMQGRDRALIIEGRVPEAIWVTAPTDLSAMLLRALVDSCVFTSRNSELSFE